MQPELKIWNNDLTRALKKWLTQFPKISQHHSKKETNLQQPNSNKEGDSVSPSGYHTSITTASRVAQTAVPTPPTRTHGRTFKPSPSTTSQPPASPTPPSPPAQPPQPAAPHPAGDVTTQRPPSWAQESTPSSYKLPVVLTTLHKLQEDKQRLGEKLETGGEANQLFKRPRGRGKGTKRGRGLRAGSVRLVSADGLPNRGRVEIFIRGQWGTVCDDLFTSKAGAVVCRQLGFKTALAVLKRAAFGEADGSVQILLDDVECQGHERSLLDCKRSRVGKHNCSHAEDVGVICG